MLKCMFHLSFKHEENRLSNKIQTTNTQCEQGEQVYKYDHVKQKTASFFAIFNSQPMLPADFLW